MSLFGVSVMQVDFSRTLRIDLVLKSVPQPGAKAGRPSGVHVDQIRKVGVDQGFTSSTPTLRLRVLGKAYFRLLDRHPELGPVFALGKRITWVSPSGTALVIDNQGQDEVTDATLDRLFARAR